MAEQREFLPIFQVKEDLLRVIRDNQVSKYLLNLQDCLILVISGNPIGSYISHKWSFCCNGRCFQSNVCPRGCLGGSEAFVHRQPP